MRVVGILSTAVHRSIGSSTSGRRHRSTRTSRRLCSRTARRDATTSAIDLPVCRHQHAVIRTCCSKAEARSHAEPETRRCGARQKKLRPLIVERDFAARHAHEFLQRGISAGAHAELFSADFQGLRQRVARLQRVRPRWWRMWDASGQGVFGSDRAQGRGGSFELASCCSALSSAACGFACEVGYAACATTSEPHPAPHDGGDARGRGHQRQLGQLGHAAFTA